MEAVELLAALLLALVVSLAIFRRSTERARHRSGAPRQPTIKVRDPAVARHALIDQADAFSNRPPTPFPVPLITGRRRSHGITTVAYGPHWRALRSNLTATILQPWRQGLLAPIRREAVASLVAELAATSGAEDAVVVVVRDSVYTAVFAMLTRVCFGDSVDEARVRSMQRMMQEFRVAIGEAKVFARSTTAKLAHWRQWRRFLAFRGEQAALFLPLIEAARQRRSAGSGDGSGSGVRPYVDSLVDLRVPDDEDDDAGRATKRRALTDDEMVSLMVEFLGAVESIVACVEWTLAHLVAQPDVQTKLRHEIVNASGDGERPGRLPYLHAVVLESLRLHPPFPLVMREVRAEGATVGAEKVPAAGGNGVRVQFMLGDIARDAKVWADPHVFRPERFLAGGEGEGVGLVPAGAKEIRMMPFGAGQRSCPGAALGVLYVESFLAALVRGFEWAVPVAEGAAGDGGGVDMTELYGFITVMKSPLRARMTPARQ